MADTRTPLEAGGYYHIYNHSVGQDNLFHFDKNYQFFLDRAKVYLYPYFDFFAYCLMPNHFHFIVKVKDYDTLHKGGYLDKNNESLHLFLSRKMSNMFNSYAQAINKQEQRKGSLFNNRYKRKPINDKKYLIKLIHYIHFNPIKSKLCNNISEWRYSSYNAILSKKETLVKKIEVLDTFGGKDNFIYCHNMEPSLSGIE